MESRENGRGGLLSAGGILSIIVGVGELIAGAGMAALFAIGSQVFRCPYIPGLSGLPNLPDFGNGFGMSLTITIIIGAIIAILGIVAIVGGISAIRRGSFGLSLAGAICALLPINAFGILAVIFISLGKREFE